jgi:nucleotide-binding universal stress UspA family protein
MEFEIGKGNVAAEILDEAKAQTSDLIVMGTHGRSGFERLVLGSVTEKILRKATSPVLSVPRDVAEAAPIPSVLFRDILCAIDFSDCSMHALNYAMSLAQEADAHLTVVHVMEPPPGFSTDADATIPGWKRSLKEYVAAAEEECRVRLENAVPESVRAYCAVESILTAGKPYREILRIATERRIDVIVIGIHGRGAADLLFFGSTAQHVVREARCPVLTLRSD